MYTIIAQTPAPAVTVNPSGNFTDPNSWATLAHTIGVPALFGVLILMAISAAGFFIARWTVGPSGWVKRLAESFIDGLLGKLDGLSVTEQKQLDLCHRMVDAHLAPGGACNLADIRTAAETTLGGLESLADNIGAAEASKRLRGGQIANRPHIDCSVNA